MKDAREKTVESVFHRVLARPLAEREEFLKEACAGDHEIYRQVASLLSAYQESRGLLESGALGLYAPEPETVPAFQEGARVSSYRIVRLLGRGGMGEVYEAYDERLKRRVALKTLPQSLASDAPRIERLKREARAASALNHPNILTIYDFGREGDTEFIVSELVEGVSLRQLIGNLSASLAIDYARQIGEALQAAHAAGIVHRDVKPENVMVRPDGYIKILDFGLAKVTSLETKSDTGELPFQADPSVPGLLIGTVSYMSPEQVRGQTVDLRTDIWSWGVVLYEMLAGHRPFGGLTSSDTVACILKQDPAPPSKHPELNRIVAKALSKTVETRYQTMTEVLQELKTESSLARLSRRRQTDWIRPLRWWQNFSPAVSRGVKGILTAALLIIVAGVSYWRYEMRLREPLSIKSIIPLTTSGNVALGAISPDGNYVAFVTEDSRGQALKVTQLGTRAETEKLPPLRGKITGLTFTPDGQFIDYVLQQNFFGKLYRLPLVAGDPKLVAEDVDSSVSFSPDGSHFVFVRNNEDRRESYLIVRSADSGQETSLATLKFPSGFWPMPLWSRDGRSVLGAYTKSYADGRITVVSIRISDKSWREIGAMPWSCMGKPVWIKNGAGFLVAARAADSKRSQLVEVTLPSGAILPVSHDTEDHCWDLDANAESNKIVGASAHRDSNLWLAPLVGTGAPRLVASGRYDFAAWTKSGHVISQTDTGGQPDLWSIDAKTGRTRRITEDRFVETDPVVSPDDQYLVYSSNREGGPHLWRANLDGSNVVRLTSGASGDYHPTFTPDGKWIIYSSNRGGIIALWKVSPDGGTPMQIAPVVTEQAEVSPDGSLIACNFYDARVLKWSTVILSAATGRTLRSFASLPADATVHWTPAGKVHWTRDGKGLLYVATTGGVSNVWLQPIDGSLPRQMTHFTEETIFAFGLSPDGSSLALIRGRKTTDLVLLESAR